MRGTEKVIVDELLSVESEPGVAADQQRGRPAVNKENVGVQKGKKGRQGRKPLKEVQV